MKQITIPKFQERHHDYVLGPNQDPRLASVAAGETVLGVDLKLDSDAPFLLRGRAVRVPSTSTGTLAALSTMWTGSDMDYRQQTFIPESLQSGAYYGSSGNPKPITHQILYPPSGVLRVDLVNNGASALTGLTFFFRGVKLFPWDSVAGYRYPPKMRGLAFSYPRTVVALGPNETRYNQVFTDKQDADFVFKAGLAGPLVLPAGCPPGDLFYNISIVLKDFSYKPFSNDFVPLDVLFGPLQNATTTGAAVPGLLYPEIYVPRNNQIFFDIQRADLAGGGAQTGDLQLNLIGQKVFPQ